MPAEANNVFVGPGVNKIVTTSPINKNDTIGKNSIDYARRNMSKTILYCRQNRCNKKYYKYFLFFKIKSLIKNELKLHYKLFNFKFAKYVT